MQTGTIHIRTDEGRGWAETWYFASDLLIIYIFPAFQGMQALEEEKKSSWMSWRSQGKKQGMLDQVWN